MEEELNHIKSILENKQKIFYRKFFEKNTDIDLVIMSLLKKIFIKFSFLYISFCFILYSLKNSAFKNKEKINFYIEKFNKIRNNMDNILIQLEDVIQKINTK